MHNTTADHRELNDRPVERLLSYAILALSFARLKLNYCQHCALCAREKQFAHKFFVWYKKNAERQLQSSNMFFCFALVVIYILTKSF